MKKYLIPLVIYGDFKPILSTVSKILLIGYFLLPHVGAQMSLGQLEYNQRMQEYRLDRLEKLFSDYTERNTIGWDKVGAICAVISILAGIGITYVKGQIKVNILEFASEVSKDLDRKFVTERQYSSGLKSILSELESIKEEQRRMRHGKTSV